MIAASQPLVTKLRPICSFRKRRWVGTMIPRKQTNEDAGPGEANIKQEAAEPIVAFSKPPPLPPVIGSLVALYMLESWCRRDNNDG